MSSTTPSFPPPPPTTPNTTSPKRALISGAGLAGPSIAFWLSKIGYTCTIVERAPSLRANGQQIDVREQGIEAVKRMGLLDELRKHTVDEAGLQFVDINGKRKAFFGKNDSGRGRQSFTSEFEIMRGNFCDMLFEQTKDFTEYRFDTMVTGFENFDDRVVVKFSRGVEESFDILIAADGHRSKIRQMMLKDFGEEQSRHLGIFGAFFTIPRTEQDENIGTFCNAPGARSMLTRWHSPDQGQGYLFTTSHPEEFKAVANEGPQKQKELLTRVFSDMGAQTARLVEGMNAADDFYYQELVQLRSSTWSRGRVVLLGDAGYAPSPLTGFGTSLALIGSYVLAGELSEHGDDVPAALKSYETKLRPFIEKTQKLPPGVPGIAYPVSQFGVTVLQTILGVISGLKIDKMVQYVLPENSNSWKLPDYSRLVL